MSIITKKLRDTANEIADLQPEDLLFVERAGVSGKYNATNLLNSLNPVTDEQAEKLDLITVSSPIDLDGIGILTEDRAQKLDSVEVGATKDQTGAEIKASYEANADTNAFNDAEKAKLGGVEAGATADQTSAEIKAAYEENDNTNALTDAEKTKISQIAVSGSIDLDALRSPAEFGANISGLDTANDLAFDAMKAALSGRSADLQGLAWPVTKVPGVNARNGYWKITDFDGDLAAWLPAKDTIERHSLTIDGGERTISWPQDVFSNYNGVFLGGYMAALGHEPGENDWTAIWSYDQCKSIGRFEPATSFGLTGDVKVFGATVGKPGGAYVGPYQFALSTNIDESDNTGLLHLSYRALAQYDQTSGGSGGLVQSETAWANALIDTKSLGAALRDAVDSTYSVTTTGLPTVAHGLNTNGSKADPRLTFGFHSLQGTPHKVYVAYITGDPRDGAASIAWVAHIGGLTSGVEPTTCWARNGGGNALVGFVRSAGSGYPMRFWAATEYTQAAVEGATIQDCPFGDDLGTDSPIVCRMRPRRKNGDDGWLPTFTTMDGSSSDEMHFVFTGSRTRNGSPGEVWLYWGSVTKGSGLFDNFWERAKIVPIMPLYFANSNTSNTSNQVGVPSMAFLDPNTLVIGASTERPAIQGDHDESSLVLTTIKLRDGYAPQSEERQWDDGTSVPTYTQQAPEHVDY